MMLNLIKGIFIIFFIGFFFWFFYWAFLGGAAKKNIEDWIKEYENGDPDNYTW